MHAPGCLLSEMFRHSITHHISITHHHTPHLFLYICLLSEHRKLCIFMKNKISNLFHDDDDDEMMSVCKNVPLPQDFRFIHRQQHLPNRPLQTITWHPHPWWDHTKGTWCLHRNPVLTTLHVNHQLYSSKKKIKSKSMIVLCDCVFNFNRETSSSPQHLHSHTHTNTNRIRHL